MNKNIVSLEVSDPAIPVILRVEAAAVLTAILAAYQWAGGSWLMLLALILVPDLSILGYLRDARTGAFLYNLAHSYIAPAIITGALWLAAGGPPSPLWLIWFAHIAFDRVLGYGLKFRAGFGHTHLGLLRQSGPVAN